MSLKVRNTILLFITAIIWGVAFVAQSVGGDAVGNFTFNAIRFIMGGIALLPVITVLDKTGHSKRKPASQMDYKRLTKAGILCGMALCLASNLQQIGINLGTAAGKAGFITACYILIVPIFSLFLGRKSTWNVWVAVFIALAGLYLLCLSGSMNLELSDGLILICALVFSIQILLVDHYTSLVDGVRLACIEFFTSGIISLIPMILIDIPKAGSLQLWASNLQTLDAWIPLLYSGLLSSGVAYTLQIVGQEGLDPTVASLIMSLEAVFSVLAGMLILHEMLTQRELAGCILLFFAIILSQLTFKRRQR